MNEAFEKQCRSCVDTALLDLAKCQTADCEVIEVAEITDFMEYIHHDPKSYMRRSLELDMFLNDHIEKAPELPDDIEAEAPDMIPPVSVKHKSYTMDFFAPNQYEHFLRTRYLPPCPPGVACRGYRGVPKGAQNVDGEQARNHRHDISWYRKVRVIHRYQELKRTIAANEYKPEKPPHMHAESNFIMAYLRLWQGTCTDKSLKGFPIDNVAQVMRWLAAYEKSGFSYCATKCRLRPRKPTHEILEYNLAEWFRDMRENNRRVTRLALSMQADKMYRTAHANWLADHPNETPEISTKASNGFINNFLQRQGIVFKSVKRMMPLTNEERSEKASKFYAHLHRYLPHTDAIANFDEIPVSIGGAMGRTRTLAYSSDEVVSVDYDSNDTKRFGTLVPVVVAKKEVQRDGSMHWEGILLATFLIFIGEPVQDRVKKERYYPGVDVIWSKCGVMTGHLMKTVIIPKIRAKLSGFGIGSCLMVLDSAKSHTSEEVIENFWAERMPVAVIPSGMTSLIQWIDVDFAKDYRLKHTERYSDWEGVRKRASQKRRLMSVMIGQACADVAHHKRIITTFKSIGYLDKGVLPKSIPNIEPPPELTATQCTETGQLIQDHMETCRVAKRVRFEKAAKLPATQPLLSQTPTAPAPAAAKKRGKKPVPPIHGQSSLTSWMHLKVTTASQPIANHVPFDPDNVPASVPATPSPTPVPGTQQSGFVYKPTPIDEILQELGEPEEVVQVTAASQVSLAVIGSQTPEGPSQYDMEMDRMIALAMADDDSSTGFEPDIPQEFKDQGYRYTEPDEDDAYNCRWSQPQYTTQGTTIVNVKEEKL